MRPLPIFLCILCCWLLSPSALAADQVVERLADLNVQRAELDNLRFTRQIDSTIHSQRFRPINDEMKKLWAEVRRMPPDEQIRIKEEVQGLTRAQISLLEPQWKQKADAFAVEQKNREQSLNADIETDARKALDYQRERLLLQQKRDRGEITPDMYQSADREALDSIQSLRGKYLAEGRQYAQEFDRRLNMLTKALASNPATPIPVSQVPEGKAGGTTPAEYETDVALAAELTRKQEELQKRFTNKSITGDTFRETDVVYNHDIVRLINKWHAVSPQKGREFERDYSARARGVASPKPSNALVSAPVSAPEEPAFPVGIVVIVLAGLGLIVLFLVFMRRGPKEHPGGPLSDNYGTASFSSVYTDIRSYLDSCTGVFLGKSSQPHLKGQPINITGAPIYTKPEHHTLIVARTRTGKGTRVIIPTLLRYDGSALVIDPKGENAAITAKTRRDQLNQHVYVINPWNELSPVFQRLGFKPATFNPLDVLDRNDPNAVAVAQSLAATICPSSPDEKDRYWQGSAANVLAAVFLWLADQPGEQKTFARARELTSMSRADFTSKVLTKMAASSAFHGAIREMVSPYIDLADVTYSGIMSNLNENTKFLSDPQIKFATASSSFALEDLIRDRTTIYLVIPPDRIDTQRTWLRLVIAAAMNAFKRFPHDQRPAHRCQFLIDEFPALGRIDDLPRDIATMSGYGIDFTLIIQGMNQLKDIYREASGIILSNCAYQWFCNLKDLESAKYLSESLGQATVRTVSRSQSKGTGADGKSTSGESTNYGEMGRLLLTPDEILNLGRDVAIGLHPHATPLYLRPIDYWQLPEAFAYLREKHPQLYWEPPLTPDPNPYMSGSEKKDSGKRHTGKSRMSEEQARSVLNVSATATASDIRAAYKRLISKFHPDKEGSSHLAQQINEAKAVLLGE